MILSFNRAETPEGGRFIDPRQLPFSFHNRQTGSSLGPVAWIDLESGAYEIRIRDAVTNEPVMVDGRYQYLAQWIDPADIVICLTANNGDALVRVTKEYAMEAATLLGAPVKQHGVLLGAV